MIQIICGEKGKGKTKILIDKANADAQTNTGSIVYLDKSNKHMYELGSKIRLINVADYSIETALEFTGFLCGLISQQYDLNRVYIDSFLKLVTLEPSDIDMVIEKLEFISAKFDVDFIISLSSDISRVTEKTREYCTVIL